MEELSSLILYGEYLNTCSQIPILAIQRLESILNMHLNLTSMGKDSFLLGPQKKCYVALKWEI